MSHYAVFYLGFLLFVEVHIEELLLYKGLKLFLLGQIKKYLCLG